MQIIRGQSKSQACLKPKINALNPGAILSLYNPTWRQFPCYEDKAEGWLPIVPHPRGGQGGGTGDSHLSCLTNICSIREWMNGCPGGKLVASLSYQISESIVFKQDRVFKNFPSAGACQNPQDFCHGRLTWFPSLSLPLWGDAYTSEQQALGINWPRKQ